MKVSLANFLLLLLVSPLAASNAQGSSACAPVDTTSLRVRQDYGDIASGTDAASASLRTTYHLPQVPDTYVVLVQDAHVCSSALSALNKDQNASHAQGLRTVIVLAIGNVYVVSDPTYKLGEWTQYTVFDSTFKTVLARVAG
jgi:hypothetical protein